ncbi:MAG: GNAT family N-acetyltransferase [Planctomycetota bacterium]
MRWPAEAPTVRAERVTLRAMAEGDLGPRLVGWLSDPVVTRFSNQRFVEHSVERCRAYLEGMRAGGNWYASIDLEGRPVGTLTAYLNRNHGTADIGILLGDREVWGKGLGQEAWDAWAAAVLGLDGLRKLTAGTLADNEPMVRLMERSGFHLEGRRVAQELVDGEPRDIVLYARFPA